MIFIAVITTVYCMLMFFLSLTVGSAANDTIELMLKKGRKDYTKDQLVKDVRTLQWAFTIVYAVLTAIAFLF